MLFYVSSHSFVSTSAVKQKETLSGKKWQDPVSENQDVENKKEMSELENMAG